MAGANRLARQSERGGILRRDRSGNAPLREWQRQAVALWYSMGKPRDYLAEATPGAGKTTFALHLLSCDEDARSDPRGTVCIVCPTAHLRRQWQFAARGRGIELCTEVAGGALETPFRGVVLTYQQVLADPERYRRAVGSGWVILDECHHAGEGKSWADALMYAFAGAYHRLLLSGTAFRSDSARIPFVRYDGDGFSIADFRYSYGDALRDGVVRPVYFVGFGGDAAWHRRGTTRRGGFGEILSREDSAARLRTVLDPGGGWMEHAVRRAHHRLLEVRDKGHPAAGALAVCMDQGHARRVAALIARSTGVQPAVALSDDPRASTVIARFAAGREPWIVAVRQVSEGTDIPRLRVGLWATNAGTELFFRQVVGRLVRVVGGLAEQDAYLYLPSDPALIRHARALADERVHRLVGRPAVEGEFTRERVPVPGDSDFQALSSSGGEAEVVFGSRIVGPAELERAQRVAEECGLMLEDPTVFAFVLRDVAGPGSAAVPLEAKRNALRALLGARVRAYCKATGVARRDAYAQLKRRAGRPVGQLAEAWLVSHLNTVDSWLRMSEQGRGAQSS